MKVYLNNFNRLTTTRGMVKDLLRMGVDARDIVIIDNNSTYEPLRAWYRDGCQATVKMLGRNIGHTALDVLFASGELKEEGLYAYSDSDLDLSECKSDLLEVLAEAVSKLKVRKAGPALRIDDIPDWYLRGRILKQESKFWTSKVPFRVEAYSAAIDTTLAVYAPGIRPLWTWKAVRVAGEYTARHAPWYYATLPDDEKFMRSIPNRPTGHWSKR